MRLFIFLFLTFFSYKSFIYSQVSHFFPAERFSSGLINDICQDKYGFIWIATDYGLNKFDGYRFTTYLNQTKDSTSLQSNMVGCLFCDAEGNLWVGTSKGLDKYNYDKDNFSHYPLQETKSARITKITQRYNGELLFGTAGFGLQTFDGNKLKKIKDGYTIENLNHYFNHVLEDRNGRIWKSGFDKDFSMRDSRGTHLMRSELGQVVGFAEYQEKMLIICLNGIHEYKNGKLEKILLNNIFGGQNDIAITTYFQDHESNIYIGTRGNGLFKLSKNSNTLERIESSSKDIDLNSAKVWAITEDCNGNLWIGCHSKGVLIIPKRQPQFQAWSFENKGINISSTITSICEGDDGITWCTIQGNGVFGFNSIGKIVKHPSAPGPTEFMYRDHFNRYWIGTDKELYSYNPKTGESLLEVTFDCDKINYITDDGKGNIYVSTFSQGFSIYNTKTREVRNFNSSSQNRMKGWICNDWVMAIMPDRHGRIWLATSSGVSCYDPKTDNFHTMGWHQLLKGVLCYSLCETSSGNIIIGTEHGLYIYRHGDKEAKPFHGGERVQNKVISYIVEAENGDLWCSTSMGIWQYDINKKQFIGHVNGNGLSAKEYINSVGRHTHDDAIYFANNHGLIKFHPKEISGSHNKLPEVKLTGFFIAGKPINTSSLSNGKIITNKATIETDNYQVAYLDNSISLEFSLFDYNNPNNIIFEYQINDGEIIQNSEGMNDIQLSHMQPGTYKIAVRAQAAGIHSPIKLITIEVTPPWYKSSLAYFLYSIIIIGILILLCWNWRRKTIMLLNEEKMKFLINTIHDIRSPLTMIMGPLAKLRNMLNDENGKKYLDTIDHNCQRLLILVNQILDERRIEKNQMQLHCVETNLVEYISKICKLYQFKANQRSITFTLEYDKGNILAWIDRINFDKVINNLLSNAFKFTYDGGEVRVILKELKNEIEIQIIDNGIGIFNEDADRLFDRFYQGRNSNNLGIQGSGIGLNLSRSIVLMHGGKIKAQNRCDGMQGACFTVTIPSGKKHLKPEQIIIDNTSREILSTGNKKKPFRQFKILIVDDNNEIYDYISEELGYKYKFEYSPNGKEAFKRLLTEKFDLVISDIMMPVMDGITLLRKIKDNTNISQLPVIMLTSKVEIEDKLEGLKRGADAYIAKPFIMEELHIQIDNLLDNVRRLRGKFSGAVQQEERMENIILKGNNDALMERIMRSVNTNMKDPNFNVETLASDAGISRAHLHRKMIEITGISAGKFLRNLRMEQASRLLSEGKVNVTQVAESVGYDDLAHFSTTFKNHYGMSPSEYLEREHLQ